MPIDKCRKRIHILVGMKIEFADKHLALILTDQAHKLGLPIWPAPGSEDTELRCSMEQEAGHGETSVYARVQS